MEAYQQTRARRSGISDPDETVRLIRSEVANLLLERIRQMNPSHIPATIREQANFLKSIIPVAPRNLDNAPSVYPPCIRHALDHMASWRESASFCQGDARHLYACYRKKY